MAARQGISAAGLQLSSDFGWPPRHQLLGYPFSVQDGQPPQGPLGPASLLFQIDTDSLTGFVFGDGGTLHVWRLGVDAKPGRDNYWVSIDSA